MTDSGPLSNSKYKNTWLVTIGLKYIHSIHTLSATYLKSLKHIFMSFI